MKQNIREYQTIKFFRGARRNNAEMIRLAKAQQDLEYRKLLIEENELDLHVYFSRMKVWKWLSWSMLILAICSLQFPVLTIILFGLALLFRFFSWVSKKNFEFVFSSYDFALGIVDMVIKDKHGISFS